MSLPEDDPFAELENSAQPTDDPEFDSRVVGHMLLAEGLRAELRDPGVTISPQERARIIARIHAIEAATQVQLLNTNLPTGDAKHGQDEL